MTPKRERDRIRHAFLLTNGGDRLERFIFAAQLLCIAAGYKPNHTRHVSEASDEMQIGMEYSNRQRISGRRSTAG